jgi:hypothetical protein
VKCPCRRRKVDVACREVQIKTADVACDATCLEQQDKAKKVKINFNTFLMKRSFIVHYSCTDSDCDLGLVGEGGRDEGCAGGSRGGGAKEEAE